MENHDAPLARSERDAQWLWATTDLYASDALWDQALADFQAQVTALAQYQGHLAKSSQQLLAYLQASEALDVLADRLANYAHRKNDEDTTQSAYQAMTDRFGAACVAAGTALSFASPELMAIPDQMLEDFYAETPALEAYRRYLTELRRRKAHILSDPEERLLAAAGEMAGAPDTIYSMLCDADFRFPDAVDGKGHLHPMSQGMYGAYLESADRTLRKSAFASMYSVYGAHRNTLAATLAAQVKQLRFYAQARRYPSALAASLDENQVPESVYHSLIAVVNQNLPLLHRYTALRKHLLGVEELHMYDLYTPPVAMAQPKIPYLEAQQTVRRALRPLGDDYLAILDEGYASRWIDVYENPGKRSGAYSAGAQVHPFVLLNYNRTLDSEFTLAHEMGHAIHSYLSNRAQRPVDADYVIFVAEVASTCNEALLMTELLSNETDKTGRAYLIHHFLEQFRTTLFRQTMFAEFELLLESLNTKGEALTAERLSEEYLRLNAKYYGDAVVCDPEIALEWARIPHFYYNYYVYQYATGFSAAIALAERITHSEPGAVEDYLRFLSAGCSQDPISLLRLAGVDLSTPAPVARAMERFGLLLDELEALCKEDAT